jgi:L-threonylcarbamoyladenylate synthase
VLDLKIKLTIAVQKQIEKGIEIIRRGGVLAFPTDTVYGVGAGAYIESAIQRVFIVKKRPREMALPLLLADTTQIHEVAINMPAYAWRLVESFLPGGLTLVVNRSTVVKDIITSGGNTVAIRIPDHPVPIALIKGSGMPIVGTSANLSGVPNAISVNGVKDQIGNLVDLVIDGGPIPGGKESTIVDVTGDLPVILRLGAISRTELEKVVKLG